jgi:hypothetical protein
LKSFDRFLSPVTEKATLAVAAVRTLAAIRDALLPRLFSGELGVRETERIIGTAT